MTFWTYILQTEGTGRYYCGMTDDVDRRVRQHNDPEYHGSKTTKRFLGPWRVIWTQEHATRADAMTLEKTIKKRGMRRVLSDQSK